MTVAAHPEERGDRVEEAADARRDRRAPAATRSSDRVAPVARRSPERATRPAGRARPDRPPCATARGSAATPPGIGDRRAGGRPVRTGEVGDEHLAAPERAVGAVAEPVEGEPEHRRRSGRARPCTRRRARGGAARRRPADRGRAANFVDRYSGCRSCATTSGRRRRARHRWSTAWRNDW